MTDDVARDDHSPSPDNVVRFDTRIVVILRDDLPGWQRVNATAFMVSGIAAGDPATVGEPYRDASGNPYLPMFREPAYVYVADAAALTQAANRARNREIPFAVFTDDLFDTRP